MKYYLITGFSSSVLTYLIILFIFTNSNNLNIGSTIKYRSTDGNFFYACIPTKGKNYETMYKNFKKYLAEESTIDKNQKLIRVSRKNYLNISRWLEYQSTPEWNFDKFQNSHF